jgi:N12 class adenine-specific DNA methylase/SAM-dependent methyltransferase
LSLQDLWTQPDPQPDPAQSAAREAVATTPRCGDAPLWAPGPAARPHGGPGPDAGHGHGPARATTLTALAGRRGHRPQRAPHADGHTPEPPAPGDDGSATPAGPAEPAPAFRPASQDELAPSGQVGRIRANLAALRQLRELQATGRAATLQDQAVLARWGGWGAAAGVFDPNWADLAWARDELAGLLSEPEWRAAERTTLNAHYTHLDLAREMWHAAATLGFTAGRVLEPGCGAGHFLALAPQHAAVTGIELDPTSAGIAAALYPAAEVRAESFAETRLPEGSFDLAIGNVPFADVRLSDRVHNPGGHSIHNHFLLKSLHLTKPGGMVLALTSRYTLDAVNPAARREMAGLADLAGAIRLPAGAHQRAAGTDAVTDLLLLRRRHPGQQPGGAGWEQSRPMRIGDAEVPINEYFHTHRRHVLGELHTGTGKGMYRADDLHVAPTGADLPGELRRALAGVTEAARQGGLGLSPAAEPGPARKATAGPPPAAQPEGHITAHDDGRFTHTQEGVEQNFHVPATQAGELRALLGLRDTYVALLDAEAAALDDTDEIDTLRAELGRRYDAYVARYGPINRFSLRRTGRTDPETGEDTYAQMRPRQGGFGYDPHAAAVTGLENFDPATGHAVKTAVFHQRVIAPRAPRLGADTPADAVAISLDAYAEVRLPEVARLLGVDETQARAQLGSLVFDDPEQAGALLPAAEYLSGNVRAKLDTARIAAADDERYAPNVTALQEAVPGDILPEQIHAALGAVWIGPEDVQAFLAETLGDPHLAVQHAGGSEWRVAGREVGVAACEVWGTERAPAPELAEKLLRQTPIAVRDTIRIPGEPDRHVTNPEATMLAQEKATALNEAFADWIWNEPARASRLARVYNDRFNSLVLRSYDDIDLSLPGLARTFEPRQHQLAAVARMIHEPAVGLYHEVGAGKTAEMVIGCMEQRRLGLVRKPCVVVPNHMLEQFSREWARLYPQAKLLVAGADDLRGEGRRRFVGRAAAGDWDGVIMTQSGFASIACSPETQAAYLHEQVAALRVQLARIQASETGLGVKRMQKALQRAEEAVKDKLAARHDPGITFEATGLDYLVCDEAHAYKNLRTPSRIPDAAIDGSNRASDLDMKLHYLRGRHGDRVGTFATATPIANSITEAYVMQKYLRPDLLEAAGIADFDSWAATFGQVTTRVELCPDASSFRLKSRFARFQNVPELLRSWHVSADVKTAADLALDTPDLAPRPGDGQRCPETVTVPASGQMQSYIEALAERAADIHQGVVSPEEDNMLKVSGDGRAAALDLRLVGHRVDSEVPTKIEVAAEKIAALHTRHSQDTYLADDGETPSPITGSLQLVFCDLGTPNGDDRFSAYDELANQLASRGVPRAGVRFIHQARNDREKGELFAAARDGHVAVLVGSTQKMGVGVNVQTRAVALHHLDCPWRPADVAQREGRILRQGNQNRAVTIHRYVTEGSFDAYSWQTVARKAEFLAQIMRGRLDVREIDDIGDDALSFTEVKALATGNPLLLDHAAAKAEVTRLERLERGHARSQARLPELITAARHRIEALTAGHEAVTAALAARRPTRGEAFGMSIAGQRHTDRGPAAAALAEAARRIGQQHSRTTREVTIPGLARLGGIDVTGLITPALGDSGPRVSLQIAGLDDTTITVAGQDYNGGTGLITRLENQLDRLERIQASTTNRIETARIEITRSQARIGEAFAHAAELATAQTRLAELETQMTEATSPGEPEPEPVPTG